MYTFKDKIILVTGGTGSMGSKFIYRVLRGELGTPKKIVVLSRDEAKQHDMRVSYLNKTITTEEVIYRNFMNILEFRIGDIRNYADVCAALKDVDIVINAAAMKQVPTCEYFPLQAVLTNCIGPANIVRAIRENDLNIDTVVAISTDKACKPVNVMGMSKSIQERIFISANILIPETRFICVRYGNVLASRGSVIPLFIEQIKNNGPVTITVPEMTRFLLSLDNAVDTVIAAIQHALPGETYVPNAPSATALNIAKALINGRDIDISIIGVRPGEKMHEIMVSEEEINHCIKRNNYYAIQPMLPELQNKDKDLKNALKEELSSARNVLDLKGTVQLLKKHKLMIEDVTNEQKKEILR